MLGSTVLWALVYAICCALLAQIRMTRYRSLRFVLAGLISPFLAPMGVKERSPGVITGSRIVCYVGGHRVPTLELAAQATTNGFEADAQPPSFAVHPPGAACNPEYEVTWGVPATERSVWLEPEV